MDTDYRRHARELDAAHSAPGTTPIADRLQQLGPARGLVFGAYGEASRDVHAVISVGASVMARATWQSFGARSEAEVRGFVMQRLRRDVGVMAAREMARHRLTRLACVGVPRHILEQRQQQRFGGRHGMRQPGMLGGLGLDDFYRHQAPLVRQQRP